MGGQKEWVKEKKDDPWSHDQATNGESQTSLERWEAKTKAFRTRRRLFTSEIKSFVANEFP